MFRNQLQIVVTVILVFLASILNSQGKYPAGYFRSPMDIPVHLSGTFGELRSSHFHTGIDIKTQGVIGKKVYAIADGYVSRINISPYGYGKAVYITHPNSYVSVYGHISHFSEKIEEYIRNIQYARESYAFDKSLSPGELPVKKGDLIGYTGNTGSSDGPHLHFEIREEKTQYPLNPLLFELNVTDNIPPEITSLVLYVMDDLSSIDNNSDCKKFKLTKTGKKFNLAGNDTVILSGRISFGIEAFDRLNGANNRNGAYSVELFVDSMCIWSYKMNKLSFYQGRYINTFIDYAQYIRSRARIQRSWIAPHNHLMIYDKIKNSGVFEFKTDSVHMVKYVVSDLAGNASELSFVVKSKKVSGNHNNSLHLIKDKGYLLLYEKDNEFVNSEVILKVPADALYEDLSFEYDKSERCSSCFSEIHRIHNIYTPLHKYVELSIKADTSLPTEFRDKALLVQIMEKGRKNAIGGDWENGFVKAETRNFGDYAIMLDTLPPKIKPVDIYPGKKISEQNTIKVRISDNLSGIKSYRGTLNGKWILMEYNVNDDMLVYHFDYRISEGKNTFKLSVVDNKDNIAEYSAILIK